MRRRGLYFNKGGGKPAIDENSLVYWVDTEVAESYSGSGKVMYDLINNKESTWQGATTYNATDKTMLTDAIGEYLLFPNTTTPVSSDFTICAFVKINTRNPTGNPGLLRCEPWNLNGGTIFNFNGATGLPMVRIKGVDVLKPLSGYETPNGVFLYISYVVKSGQFVKYYTDGIERHTANTTVTFPEFTFNSLGKQYATGENVWGDYKGFQVYKKALTQTEIANNNTQLRNFYGL